MIARKRRAIKRIYSLGLVILVGLGLRGPLSLERGLGFLVAALALYNVVVIGIALWERAQRKVRR